MYLEYAFDTLAYAKRLKDVGVENEIADKHAELQGEVMTLLITKTLANKEDIHRLEMHLSKVDAMDLKFDVIYDRFDAIDRKFVAIDERFDAIDKKFDAMDARFEAIDKKFDAIDARFEAIDKKFDAMDARFEAIDKKFDAIDARFDAIDKKFDAIDARFEAIDKKFDAMDQKFEDRFKTLENRVVTKLGSLMVILFGVLYSLQSMPHLFH